MRYITRRGNYFLLRDRPDITPIRPISREDALAWCERYDAPIELVEELLGKKLPEA